MSNYEEQLRDLISQYKILIRQFKEIYPIYKQDPKNPENQKLYRHVQQGIQNVFYKVEQLNKTIEIKNNNSEKDFNQVNKNLKRTKSFFHLNKKKLQDILDKNNGAEPRESQFNRRLRYKYIDFLYILMLLGIVIYSLRKLVK